MTPNPTDPNEAPGQRAGRMFKTGDDVWCKTQKGEWREACIIRVPNPAFDFHTAEIQYLHHHATGYRRCRSIYFRDPTLKGADKPCPTKRE